MILFDFKVLAGISIPDFTFSKISFYSPQPTKVILQMICEVWSVITFLISKAYWRIKRAFWYVKINKYN